MRKKIITDRAFKVTDKNLLLTTNANYFLRRLNFTDDVHWDVWSCDYGFGLFVNDEVEEFVCHIYDKKSLGSRTNYNFSASIKNFENDTGMRSSGEVGQVNDILKFMKKEGILNNVKDAVIDDLYYDPGEDANMKDRVNHRIMLEESAHRIFDVMDDKFFYEENGFARIFSNCYVGPYGIIHLKINGMLLTIEGNGDYGLYDNNGDHAERDINGERICKMKFDEFVDVLIEKEFYKYPEANYQDAELYVVEFNEK